jgi:hypothetical protein
MNRDPQLIDNLGYPIPLAERTEELRDFYRQRSIAQLPSDVTKAFDRLWQVEREKDRLAAQLVGTQKKLRHANLKIWLLSLIVSPIVSEILKALFRLAYRH